MKRHVENSGIALFGGTANITGSAVGNGASVHVTGSPAPGQRRRNAGLGVVTVIAEEASAVRVALGLEAADVDGLSFDVGSLQVNGRPVTIAATRALAQGQESAMAAYHRLREHFHPAIMVLAGIAGGIHRDVRLGDVVVATRVICYDLRKETLSGTVHRGQERQAPAEIGQGVNEFFTACGDPAVLHMADAGEATDTLRVTHGPIGSGNAVIANRDSEILAYLARFNDKVLAVDMEAAGFSQAHHEDPVTAARPRGWLVVRGISDDAGPEKNDQFHHLAARNAALALRALLPYLPIDA